MADADRVLVPLSRRAFDLYAMSLPFGPNYGDAEFVTAFKAELAKGRKLEDLLVPAFAVVRDAWKLRDLWSDIEGLDQALKAEARRLRLRLRDKLFLSWLAPRGIVAAAVSSLFALELTQAGIAGGVELKALVFLVIAMTVTLQGLSGGPVASLLGVRRATNSGYLLLGANPIARHLARQLSASGEEVMTRFISA